MASWETVASDREKWKSTLFNGTAHFESERIQRAILKRSARKMEDSNISNGSDAKHDLTCPHCGRILLSKAGYVGHVKSHERHPSFSYSGLVNPSLSTCEGCGKLCKSVGGLKLHSRKCRSTVVNQSGALASTDRQLLCHHCKLKCKSLAGLKSHLRARHQTSET